MKTFLILTLLLNLKVFASNNIAFILNTNDEYNQFIRKMYESAKVFINYYSTQSELRKHLLCSHDGTVKSIQKAVKVCARDSKILIGGITSDHARLLSKITKDSDKIIISPTASSHKVRDFNKNVFRFTLNDEYMSQVFSYIHSKEANPSTFLYWNLSKLNTNFIAKEIYNTLNKAGINFFTSKLLSDDIFKKSDISTIKKNKIELISLFSFESDLRKVTMGLKDIQHKVTFVGADGWGSNEHVANKYSKNKNFRFLRALAWNSMRNDVFYNKIKEKIEHITKNKLTFFTALSFDIMSVLNESLIRSKEKGISVLEILKTHSFKNLLTTGNLKFDHNLSAMKDIYIYEIVNNKIKLYGRTNVW